MADFTAFNDVASGPQTHANTTLYKPNGTASGFLVDVTSGQTTTVFVTTSQIGVRYANSGANPAAGTDAYEIFNGFVDLTGQTGNGLEISGGDFFTYTFSQLDTASVYDFAGTAIRGNNNYRNRWTLVTLNGAASFVARHSSGDGVYTDGLDANQAALWVGANHNAGQGWVVRWADIDPGADGTFEVVSQQYTGPIPTTVDPGGMADGSKGYAISGMRLVETLSLPGLPVVVNVPATNITGGTARIGGTITDIGSNAPNVTVFYGDEDGINQPGNWDHEVDLGVQAGGFSTVISNLNPGGTYYFRCRASNTVGTRWAVPSLSFAASVIAPAVDNRSPENITGTSAELRGAVTASGGETPVAAFYYGTADPGATFGWEASIDAGVQPGPFSRAVSGLDPLTTYFYRAFASNSAGGAWAPTSASFRTAAVLPPAVTNTAATDITGTSAVLHGLVTDTGGDVPFVTVYYGGSDGGMLKGNWEHAVAVGLSGGSFLAYATGLDSETTYHYRVHARNAAGEAWAPVSSTFTTLVAPELTVVINEVHYDPDDKTRPVEFIELLNTGTQVLDISGWSISDAVDYVFPPASSIGTGAYLVICQDTNACLAEFGVQGFGQWEAGDRLSNQGEEVTLRNGAGAAVDRVDYGVGFPWPTSANGEGSSMELIHPLIDNDLGGAWRSSVGDPTPGAANSVYTTNIPPRIRQVDHGGGPVAPGVPVTVTAKVTDPNGVGGVSLAYQLVEPGDYVAINDPRYATDWTTVTMTDDGTQGDAVAGDSRYSVVLQWRIQTHRRLVRYRITATDTLGNAVTVPYDDDGQPNFAYFCYGAVPDWTGSARPGVEPDITYSSSLLTRLPVYHLITTGKDHEEAMYIPDSTAGRYGGSLYQWRGALVYDGVVYDHIRFRARGGVWRYAMGKNMWKFDFNRARSFQARDDYGKKYATTWDKLNFSALIQQGNFRQRGEQGLFEGAGFKLHNLAGNPAPKTHYVHFRIIEHADETGPTASQYDDDFQGLYMVIEQLDGRFINEHELPDGNLYKMEGGSGTLNNQGATQPKDKSDLNAFFAYKRADQTPQWWEDNLDLEDYFSFRAMAMGIHDYDIHANKNYFYFHNPDTEKWQVINWDLDLCWTTTYNGGGGNGPLNREVLVENDFPQFVLAYNNRLRELVDLLYNPEQTGMLLDEIAQWVYTPGAPSFVDADRAMWDYNPILTSSYINSSKAGHGRYHENSPTDDFAGMIQICKNFVANKVNGYLAGNDYAFDPKVRSDEGLQPDTPAISYAGASNYPINALTFHCSAFSGGSSFAAMEWRIAEFTNPASTNFDPFAERKYEITATWESGALTNFDSTMVIPGDNLRVGRNYRARVRMQGDDGRWSHWSAPVEFVVGDADNTLALTAHLVVSECMYNPRGGDGLEYVELHNTSATLSLNLSGNKFTSGIDYTMPPGTELAPGAYLLVVRAAASNDFAGFRAAYGLGPSAAIVGPYDGKLANDGESVVFKTASAGTRIFSFTYGDGRGWPLAADGAGHAIVPLPAVDELQAAGALDYPGNWRAGTFVGGSPGRADPLPPPGVVINEMVAHTDFSSTSYPDHDSNDWIEFLNRSPSPVSLDGWYLSDDRETLTKWAFPATNIPGGSFLELDEISGFHIPITNGFGLNKAGEELWLSWFPGTTNDRVVDAYTFKGQENGVALGRVPGGDRFRARQLPTRGAPNVPALGDVLISELMYNPVAVGTNLNEDDVFEYVELHNPLPSDVPLFNTEGVWRINGGIDFDFPAATRLAAGASLVVVPFEPADTVSRTNFLAHYGLTEGAADLLGPYRGKLSDRCDRIALERPQGPDLPDTNRSWVVVDELIYADQFPFPTSADGGGSSLHRRTGTLAGNDPANWKAAAPTPGEAEFEILPDQDGDTMADNWEVAHFGHLGRDGSGDRDADGSSDAHEFHAGTIPTDGDSVLALTDATPDGAGGFVLAWSSVTGKTYAVRTTTNLTGVWQPLTGNIPATPALNVRTVTVEGVKRRYYRIAVEP